MSMTNDNYGLLVLGLKETIDRSICIPLFYIPTLEQIRNFKSMFGWDYVTKEEAEKLLYGK